MGDPEGPPAERQHRVYLADDHPLIRTGIKTVITGNSGRFSIVGEGSNGLEVLEFARGDSADVYVLDIAMPELNGIQTTEKLLKLDPDCRVIILSVHTDRKIVRNALRSGARGYVVKDSATREIVRAIEEVLRGNFFLSPSVSGSLVDRILGTDAEGDGKGAEGGLTRRQREILVLLCDGLSEKEIAYRLHLSYNSVHTHKYNLMKRLDIHSTAELVKYAVRTGLIPLDPGCPADCFTRRMEGGNQT